MSGRDAWLKLFPLAEAEKAVNAVCQGWRELSARQAPGFQHDTQEPDLTLVLTEHVRDVISPRFGLLGSWGAEQIGGIIDPKTLKIKGRHRTDIQYHWNDTSRQINVVFEFKKLDHTESSRKHYYGPKGMERFVTGPYGKRQPLAIMAGILTGPYDDCVPGLRQSLQSPDVSRALQMHPAQNGDLLRNPSKLFPNHAEFDTEHTRPKELAPEHGTIHLSHLFLSFPFENVKKSQRQRKNRIQQ